MFELNSRLAADSILVDEDETLMIRLIDDARFPWVLLIPKIEGISELHELGVQEYKRVIEVAKSLGAEMMAAFDADKINTAAIGNLVPQLHIHVVARQVSDAAWPAPVWGHGDAEPLAVSERARRIKLVQGMELLKVST